MHRWFSVLVVAALPWVGQAAESTADRGPVPSEQHTACMEKAGGVTADMVSCITAEYERQDKRLNDAYAAARERVGKGRDAALRDVQRAWLHFRDLNCDFRNDPDGGTLARVEANHCMLSMTAARADELEGIANRP